MNTLIGRRPFIQRAGLTVLGLRVAGAVALTGVTFEEAGCTQTVAQIIANIKNWIPIGVNAFNTILSLLESAGIINPVEGAGITMIIGLIQGGFTQVTAAITQYESIVPPPQGALASIEAALQIVVNNFQNFLTSINVPSSPLLTTIVGFANLILETITGFVQLLPVGLMKLKVARNVTVSGQAMTVTPNPRTIRSFKKSWNKVAIAGGHPESQFHVTFWEHF